MINVMIVEDEPPIARALEKLIERIDSEFRIVGIAENGQEAIEHYPLWKPDVVFTDIKMPIMDGFQFLEFLKRNEEQPVTIILSGYEDFNYARQAISYKVKGYLLKPVSRAELEQNLNEIKQEIYASKKIKKEDYVKEKLKESEQIIQKGNCTVSIFCFGAYPMTPDDGMLPGIQDVAGIDFEKAVECLCPGISSWVINGNSSVEKTIILEGLPSETGFEILQRVYDRIRRKCTVPVTCVTHSEGVAISSIGGMFKALKVSLYKNLIFGLNQIYCYDGKEGKKEKPDLDGALKRLRKEIADAGLERGNEQLRIFLSECKEHSISQRSLAKYLNMIMGYYYERYPMMKTRELEVESILGNARTYQELYEEIISFLNMLCNSENTLQEVNPLAQKVKDYLDGNYRLSITSESLTKEFGFVSAYLSRVFKNQYGLTPSAYLLKIRIEHAKEMLKGTGECLVKEVAEAVGYNDPYYFSKVFHKETSVWPTDYKG